MKLKKVSLSFLLVLFIILVFIVGVRHGQNVEKTNKIIDYLISLTPKVTPTTQPSKKPPKLEFKTYESEGCAVQFLYPSTLSVKDSSSRSALLADLVDQQLELTCINDEKGIPSILNSDKYATAEVTFRGKKVKGKLVDNSRLIFKFVNPQNTKTIFISVSKSLFPLFEKTLEFTR